MLSFKRYPMKEESIYLLELIVIIAVGLSEQNWLMMFVLALS